MKYRTTFFAVAIDKRMPRRPLAPKAISIGVSLVSLLCLGTVGNAAPHGAVGRVVYASPTPRQTTKVCVYSWGYHPEQIRLFEEIHPGHSMPKELRMLGENIVGLSNRPEEKVVFISSMPVPESIIEAYLGLIPKAKRDSVRSRILLFPLKDPSDGTLAEKALRHPRLSWLRNQINPERSYLDP
jgi:hypothetical protein